MFFHALGLYTLLVAVSASPLTFILSDQYGQKFMIPFYRNGPIERSDSSHNDDYASDLQGHNEGGFEPSTGQFGEPLGYGESFHFDHDKGFDGGHAENFDHQGEDIHREYHGNNIHSVPVSEHVEVTKPVAVPVIREIGVPVPQPVNIHIPHPVAVGVPQPYPVAMPVSHPVPIQIIKTVAVPVEKKVPFAVEKHIPVAVEKPVPIHIERHIPVPVEKPYPIKVPVYKTIHHHTKSHHGH